MLPYPFIIDPDCRSKRSLSQDVEPFFNNLIFQYTNPLPFETEPHSISTIPLLREHLDSYLYYFRYKTLEINISQQPFQVIFNPVKNINSGTFYRTIHPQNLTSSIQDIFTTYIDKLIEHNENLETPLYRSSHLETLKQKAEYFEVPDLETTIQRHDNPHYWLQQDLLQVTTFQYKFFQDLILNDDTIPQIRVFSHFLLKFFRFNYQLLWEQKDQNAYINFPQVLTETELLPFIIRYDFKHPLYIDFATFPVQHFQNITLNQDFIAYQLEISVNRPYVLNANPLIPDTNTIQHTINNQETNPQYPSSLISQDSLQTIHNPQNTLQDNTMNNPNESLINDENLTNDQTETSQTGQDTTESLQNTIVTQPTNYISASSSQLQIPIHNIAENPNNLFGPNNTSTSSITNTTIIQPPQLQQRLQRNYDPPPPPTNNSIHSTPHSSPQQGSPNTNRTQNQPLNQSQFHIATPPQQSTQSLQYIPAQSSISQNTNPILTINTLHTNPGYILVVLIFINNPLQIIL